MVDAIGDPSQLTVPAKAWQEDPTFRGLVQRVWRARWRLAGMIGAPEPHEARWRMHPNTWDQFRRHLKAEDLHGPDHSPCLFGTPVELAPMLSPEVLEMVIQA